MQFDTQIYILYNLYKILCKVEALSLHMIGNADDMGYFQYLVEA